MNRTIFQIPSRFKHLCALPLVVCLILSGCAGETSKAPDSSTTTSTQQSYPKTSGPIDQPESSNAKTLVLNPENNYGNKLIPWSPDGIKEFELTERSGKKVTKADLLGKPWVACFVFSSCVGPCLDISKRMNEIQGWTKDVDVRLVSISVDPKNDTPERLREYAKILDADKERWLFLTGNKDTIYGLARDDFKTAVGVMAGEPFHTSNIFHIDAGGRIISKYNATEAAEMEALRKTLVEGTSTESPAPAPTPAGKPAETDSPKGK